YKNPNGRAGKNSVNFFLTLTLLAFIAFFMLIGNTKLNGNYKDSTNDVRISSLPGIRELYAEEANKFKREFHKLTLQATKKVLSHPYELVRYGVGVEININYKWKQLHCNKKTSIFKNGVCAVEKSKKAKRSANQHNKFNRTIEY
ncbi:6414_t:CDS:1, partial [Acaulospora morrowiae]